jgi:MFS superfamily sulfate permease-like transporter
MHGALLLLSVILVPGILNLIPLGVLAAILLVVGFKLAKPVLFKKMYKQGWEQFVPFMVTIIGIVLTDLLIGIACGLFVAIFIILRNNFKIPYKLQRENLEGKDKVRIVLSEDVTFLNKASVQKALAEIPDTTNVIIDATDNHFIHHDVIEIIEDFKINATTRGINVSTIDLEKNGLKSPPQHFRFAE